MKEASAVVFLVARLLILGSEGTQTLSEHHARVPLGGTGVLTDSLDEAGLPGALALYLTPSLGVPDEEGAPAPVEVSVRSDLWTHAAEARHGGPPDERNTDHVVLGSGSSLLQIAESGVTGRRLMLSLSAPSDHAPPPAAPSAPRNATQISFVVEAYKSTGTERELLGEQTLRALEGSPVVWEYGWKKPAEVAGRPLYVDEGVTLTLTPLSRSEGWISVEARLVARVQESEGAEPVDRVSTATRTVALGIPFEISVETPSAQPAAPETDGEGPESTAGKKSADPVSFLVQITPYLPVGVNPIEEAGVH